MDENDIPIGISDDYINMNNDTDMTTAKMIIVKCQKVQCNQYFRVTHRMIVAHINLYNNTGDMVQMCIRCLTEYCMKRGGSATGPNYKP